MEIVFLCRECKRSFDAIAKCFNEMHPERPIDHSYESRLIKKFKETLRLWDKKRSGRPKVDENDFLAHISADPQKS